MKRVLNVLSILSCLSLVAVVGIAIVSAASNTYTYTVSPDIPAAYTASTNYNSTGLGVNTKLLERENSAYPVNVRHTLYEEGWLWDTEAGVRDLSMDQVNAIYMFKFTGLKTDKSYHTSIQGTDNVGRVEIRLYSAT